MSNLLYPTFKQALGAQTLETALGAAMDLRAVLADAADYTFNVADEFLDDIPAGAIVAVSATIPASWLAAVLDCDDFTFPGGVGDESEKIVFYAHDGGADGARRLIAHFDTGVTGLPVTPNGAGIDVTINASGIFAL